MFHREFKQNIFHINYCYGNINENFKTFRDLPGACKIAIFLRL